MTFEETARGLEKKKLQRSRKEKKYNIELIVLCCTAQRIGIVLDHSGVTISSQTA